MRGMRRQWSAANRNSGGKLAAFRATRGTVTSEMHPIITARNEGRWAWGSREFRSEYNLKQPDILVREGRELEP